MHRHLARAVAVALVGACGAPAPARYAGWEPMPEGIPAPRARATALRYLAESRSLFRLWLEGPPPDRAAIGRAIPTGGRAYSYVRARQLSEDRVDFTLFVVNDERVVVRALVSADPAFLDSAWLEPEERRVRSLWVERGDDVGQRTDGMPPRTIDELYDDCTRLVASRPDLEPRLYFHPNGVLMHCGFAFGDCSSCAAVSIQSFSRLPLDDAYPPDAPHEWLCARPWGVVAPATPVPTMTLICHAPPAPAPARSTQGSLENVCAIDPAACPGYCATDACRVARWSQPLAPSPCPAWPERDPRPLELGKADPRAVWTFPFTSGGDIECGSRKKVLHEVRP